MITEDYVSFKIAKLLKEKGFEILTNKVYDNQGKLDYQNVVCWQENRLPYISAPTHQMAMKWLREEHKLSIDICTVQGKGISYMFNIWDFSTIHDNKFIGGMFDLREQLYDFLTHEDAVEAALKYSLENLI